MKTVELLLDEWTRVEYTGMWNAVHLAAWRSRRACLEVQTGLLTKGHKAKTQQRGVRGPSAPGRFPAGRGTWEGIRVQG